VQMGEYIRATSKTTKNMARGGTRAVSNPIFKKKKHGQARHAGGKQPPPFSRMHPRYMGIYCCVCGCVFVCVYIHVYIYVYTYECVISLSHL